MNTVAERHLTDDQLLRVPAVAEILATSESFVWGLIRRSEIESVKLCRVRRIPRSAVDKLIHEGLLARRADATPEIAS